MPSCTNGAVIVDFEEKSGIISAFRSAIKCLNYFYHIVYLESCKHVDATPSGLQIRNKSFIRFDSPDIIATWESTIESTQRNLLDSLLVGLHEKMINFEISFWNELSELEEKTSDFDNILDWYVKLIKYFNKEEETITKRKRKKIRKLLKDNGGKIKDCLDRFDEHLQFFDFKNELLEHGRVLFPDFDNLLCLVNISSPEKASVVDNIPLETSFSDSPGIAVEQEGRLKGVYVSENVLNLSKRVLNEAEISLLSKGLKFVPTPNFVDKAALKQDLERFGRKLRLAWHFRNDQREYVFNPFRKKSNFKPKDQDAAIEMYLSALEQHIFDINTKIRYHNITKEERRAIDSLRNDPTIIIKEADKGSCVVVWDREDYLKEADSQLSDTDVYESLSGDFVSPLVKIIKNCIDKIDKRGDISRETLDYFLVDNPKAGRFYLLPKIHKRLFNVPGRPVISNSAFYTENISAFLDFHLKPLAKLVKSFVKDTNDFLKKLSSLPKLPEDVFLCTVDVVGLYPSIPHEDGLNAIRSALNSREDKQVSTESLLELAKVVLENNVFEHNSKFYRQLQGTAIGTKMAPNYAILFMAELEEKILNSFSLKPMVWWRYIDDIFFLWQHGEENLNLFLDHLNKAHPTIKFTAEYSKSSINFLDVKVSRKGDRLTTDLFVKPTDTHQYLQASSCHPSHCKTSIPFSQALRLNRICSETRDFDRRCNDLEAWLIKRGYNERLVRSKVLDARRFKRSDLLNREKSENKDHKLTLNITYHPAFSVLNGILKKLHVILNCDQQHCNVFPERPIVGFRRGKSLKDFLVRAKVPKLEPEQGECVGCQDKRCKTELNTGTSFSDNEGKTYRIRDNTLNCDSANVVYLITCKACGLQYVGSTKNKFRARYKVYKSNQKLHKTKKVMQQQFHEHFDLPGHSGWSDFDFILIDQGISENDARKREMFWQYKLNTFLPKGLNEREVDFI